MNISPESTPNRVESEKKKYLRLMISATIGIGFIGLIVIIYLFLVLSQEISRSIISEEEMPIVSAPMSYPESFPVSY